MLSFISISLDTYIPFNGIHLRFYTKISLNPNVSVEQLVKRKTWKRSWWEIFLREGFFRYCSCGNWHSPWHRGQLRFSEGWIEKKETFKERSIGKTTLSFDIILRYFFICCSKKEDSETYGIELLRFFCLSFGCIKKKSFISLRRLLCHVVFYMFPIRRSLLETWPCTRGLCGREVSIFFFARQ